MTDILHHKRHELYMTLDYCRIACASWQKIDTSYLDQRTRETVDYRYYRCYRYILIFPSRRNIYML